MAAKKILVVDDSALMRRLISDIINSDNRFCVKDLATNGLEALDLIIKNQMVYDAVVLDINMPKMNGLELLEQLQKHRVKINVIMVSTLAKEGAKETIIALERGAFDFVTKPENYLDAKEEHFKNRLLEVLSVAAKADMPSSTAERPSVIKKTEVSSEKTSTGLRTTAKVGTSQPARMGVMASLRPKFKPHKKFTGSKEGKSKLVALACSTGGPKSLQSVIPKLPANLDAPVVMVQHMPKGFTNSLAMRLNEMSQVTVKEAADGDVLQKGWVYIAPGGKQMRVLKVGGTYKIAVTDEPARDALKPCANIMYESLVCSNFDEITCVVLTGMGADGTIGIGTLGETINVHVIAQDEATSVVYGMPKAIAEANIVDEVLPLEKIADAITKNVGVLNNGR
ncbi:MAG: chemotaxis-specific protein-glutamate methyltransferase CheB [Lachnospiraceae bacterium]|nr:chemotaxis-specific protein-glutamate methyltransferase CheB [Lachnospiraceae bacterium]MEE0685882.1 chemotaxis-specific protein-glutamate methyltransferase CheB [Lachnospiraceae bacterium]MEE0862180.1 chemotaxis-specific protein-glutamate methyltransferase CheB [Lachnospiraceae bacterium]